jgi:hypothetical protein
MLSLLVGWQDVEKHFAKQMYLSKIHLANRLKGFFTAVIGKKSPRN